LRPRFAQSALLVSERAADVQLRIAPQQRPVPPIHGGGRPDEVPPVTLYATWLLVV